MLNVPMLEILLQGAGVDTFVGQIEGPGVSAGKLTMGLLLPGEEVK